MRAVILAFSAGDLIAGFMPVLPPASLLPLLLLPFVLSLRLPLLRLPGVFLLGVAWLLWWAIQHEGRVLPESLEQQDLWISGHITGLPQYSERSTRFTFDVDKICASVAPADCRWEALPLRKMRLLLNDYNGLRFRPGQRWQFRASLKRPHGFANPGGFDYEAWLFQQQIAATGNVRDDQDNQLLSSPSGFNALFDRLRYRFQTLLAAQPLRNTGFISALTIGDRYLISDRQWSLLAASGTNHLMVISGLHITLVAWLAFSLTRLLGRVIPALPGLIPLQRLGAVVALCAAWSYGGLAGLGLPVQRALVMISCLMCGWLFTRQTSPTHTLCLALFIVLLLDPLAPQLAGFWLSFLAVSFLILCLFRAQITLPLMKTPLSKAPPTQQAFQGILPQPASEKMKNLLCSQGYLFLGMMPTLLMWFGKVSLLAPLVNLVAIPFIGMVVVPLCLLAFGIAFFIPDKFAFAIQLADFLLAKYLQGLAWLVDHAGFLLVEFPSLPVGWLCLLFTFNVLALIRPGRNTLLPAALWMLACFFYRPEKLPRGSFLLDILDVGQGLAVVVTTRNHVLIYDAGPLYSPRFNAGSGVIIPFLHAINSASPDRLVISHGDNDHAGGLQALLEQFPRADVLSGETLRVEDRAQFTCLAGMHWQWDSIRFEFFSPDHGGGTGNNASCVLKISSGAYSALLPGDIEQEVELALVRQYEKRLQSDILIAPHHGSNTSSTTPFVRRVHPEHVIFTSGYLNRFGHPTEQVVTRYRHFESNVLETSRQGAIRFRISARHGITEVDTWRDARRRFWSALGG